jgi:hypothetical protein
MNKDYFVKQLMTFAEEYKIEVSEELVGDIVSLASFRVVKKGEILASIGDDTTYAGLILSGVARAYYIDKTEMTLQEVLLRKVSCLWMRAFLDIQIETVCGKRSKKQQS